MTHAASEQPSPLPLTEGIVAAVRHEVREGGDEGLSDRLRIVVDALVHRALIDDARPLRLAGAARELERLVEDLDSTPPAVEPDGQPIVTDSVGRVAAALVSAGGVRLQQVVELLVDIDFPEVGSRASQERLDLESRAMNSLGTQTGTGLAAGRVRSYLRHLNRFDGDIEVLSVARLSGGFSKDTLLVVVQDDAGIQEIVLRPVVPGGDASTLSLEFDVVRHVWTNGIPAPEPLWLDEAPNALGGALIASRRIVGENPGDVFGPASSIGAALATNLASVLARLHELDLDGLDRTPVPPMVSRGDILARVDEQEQGLAVAAPTSRSPYATLCALLLAWLRCHAPDGPERPSLCHGDVGFHNMLASGGDVVGLVDWERAVLGDPAQDLAYVRPQVEQVVPWQAFLDDYGAAGGHPPKADVLEYYSVWHDVWRAIGCLRRRARFERSPTRVSDAVAALLHGPRFTSGAVHTALGVQP